MADVFAWAWVVAVLAALTLSPAGLANLLAIACLPPSARMMPHLRAGRLTHASTHHHILPAHFCTMPPRRVLALSFVTRGASGIIWEGLSNAPMHMAWHHGGILMPNTSLMAWMHRGMFPDASWVGGSQWLLLYWGMSAVPVCN